MKIELINKSKNRYWKIEYYLCNDDMYLNMQYGKINGKSTERVKRISQKNIGKVNETSLQQQALNEMISLAKEKIDAGYELINKTNIQELDNYIISDVYFPMLANKYDTKLINPNTAIAVQGKLDGCVSGDSIINTQEYGNIPIKEIVDNKILCNVMSFDIINNHYEYKPIINHFKNKNKDSKKWYLLELNTGEKLTLTGNHKIYLNQVKKWVRIDEIIQYNYTELEVVLYKE